MPSSGPSPCDVLVVGEAFGKEEDALQVPFVGTSGQELRRMLDQAGWETGGTPPWFRDSSIRFTNVFMERPRDNKIESFCGKRGEVPRDYPHPPLSTGHYVLPCHLHHLAALGLEIRATRPRLIIALGNTATWALLNRTGISKLRGNMFPCELVDGPMVLPTYHPANILREWGNRVIALGDLIKAKRWIDEGFSPPRRELWLAPTMEEVQEFCHTFILGATPRPSLLSLDVETYGETVTCVGFAPDPARAICIPFFDPDQPDRNYWRTAREELAAWRIVYDVCTSDIPKLGQNGLYDIQRLLHEGIPIENYLADTMIRHHSLYPEMEKGLGFMGSVYTDEAPWKLLRDRKKDLMFKGDDE